ncbi:hypothetical protein LCGC14_0259430 [marine sediment metagenome]|uniref:Uncharacterized protein n=1 Tax=marine sediment metagenome TaxID=412755 RepID=A0A0F9X7D4_9ZZZZ
MTDFEALGTKLGRLVTKKRAAYGNSHEKSGEVLAILYPGGVQPDQYGDMLTVARVLDKLFRVATDRGAYGESPWKDVAGYGLLGWAAAERRVVKCGDGAGSQR